MSNTVLGIDPGHDGGASLLDASGATIRAWSWRKLDRKSGRVYRVSDENEGGLRKSELRHLVEISHALDTGLWCYHHAGLIDRWHLAVEGLFVHRAASKDTAIELGRAVGWLTAYLVSRALTYHDSAIAGEWRPAVLGCAPNASSNDAERLALLRFGRRWTGELATDPHVAEADAIAWYRRVGLQLEAQQAAQMDLIPQRSSRRRRA